MVSLKMAVDGNLKFYRKWEDTNVALLLISLDHRLQTCWNGQAAFASVTRLIEVDLREARVELLSRSRSWSVRRRSRSGGGDPRRRHGQDVEVVDLEFDRAVFGSPFAVEVQ